MGFNLNRNSNPDYELKTSHIEEVISIYGVEADLIFTTKMNADKILNDFTHMQAGKNTKKIMLLPEETEDWGGSNSWNAFGLDNLRTISFFISRKTINEMFVEYPVTNYKEYINNLLVLPNSTVLEITDIEAEVEGVNNLFTYSDEKSVYRVTSRVYSNSKQDEIEHSTTDTEAVTVDEDTIPGIKMINYSDDKIIDDSMLDIDEYFKTLDDDKVTQDTEGDVISDSNSIFGTLG